MMAKGRRSRGTEDREDVETYKGVIREQRKQIQQLQRENARLTKYIDNRYEMIYDEEDGEVTLQPLDVPKIWRCRECKSEKHTTILLGKGEKEVVLKICKDCGRKESSGGS